MMEGEDNLNGSEAAGGPTAEIIAKPDAGDDLFPPMPDVWHVANNHIFQTRQQELSGVGGYRRKYSNPPPPFDEPAMSFPENNSPAAETAGQPAIRENIEHTGTNSPEEINRIRVSSKLQLILNNLEITNKHDLIRVLQGFADISGLFFCPLIIPPPANSKTVLPGEPLKTFNLGKMAFAVFIEPIGEGHCVIKAFQRPISADRDWYPLSRKDRPK
jgi:hypothetical protein